jgi:hypothetical protein
VAGVTDQDDVEVIRSEATRLEMHLRHDRTGGVDGAELTLGRLLVNGGSNAVRGKHDNRALGDLVVLLDENGPHGFEPAHDVKVVNNLTAHVNRRSVGLEGSFDRLDCTVDAGAITSGAGQQDTSHALKGTGR